MHHEPAAQPESLSITSASRLLRMSEAGVHELANEGALHLLPGEPARVTLASVLALRSKPKARVIVSPAAADGAAVAHVAQPCLLAARPVARDSLPRNTPRRGPLDRPAPKSASRSRADKDSNWYREQTARFAAAFQAAELE